MEQVSVAMLGTVAGVAFFVGIIAQAIKPLIKEKYAEKSHEKYSFYFNGLVLLLGVLIGVAGALLLNDWPPTPIEVATGVLIGLVGGATATGGAEFLGNWDKARKQ